MNLLDRDAVDLGFGLGQPAKEALGQPLLPVGHPAAACVRLPSDAPVPLVLAMSHLLDPLAALAHTDGGWGYVADQPAHLEPTCLALLALRPEAERFAAGVASGRAFLRACRRP